MTGTSDSRVLRVEHDGPVAIVTLNRPDHLNAFDDDLHRQFSRFWIDLEHDHDTRAVVITGAGKAFSAGGNRDDFEALRTDLARRDVLMRGARRIVNEMLNVRVPVVAAVNGAAVGLGSTLASLCDIVFLADDAHFADPHVMVALVAGDGGAVTWPHMTSMLKVKQYLLTGDPVPPDEAVAIGLANFLAPAGEVVARATAFAHRMARLPPQAVQDTKMVLNQHLRLSAVTALGYGLAAETRSHDTPEYAEVAARFQSRGHG